MLGFLSLLVLRLGEGVVVAETPFLAPAKPANSIRIATYNVSMNRSGENRLTEDLTRGDSQIQAVAAVIRAVRPDIILLNEIDYSTTANNALLFEQNYLNNSAADLLGNVPHSMPYWFSAPVNTGVASGLDLNRNGRSNDPEDAWGFGRFPGQYGMAVLSRFPIDVKSSRTFQKLLWSKFPNAVRPIDPNTNQPYFDDATWKLLRLPSKSFWDVVIHVQGSPIHLLASHPTPPAFDGPEDRNGCRNNDEVRLLLDYITPIVAPNPEKGNLARANLAEQFWIDDQGRPGRSQLGEFVILGDLNIDPLDGDGRSHVMQQLLGHSRVQSTVTPVSQGAVQAAKQQGQKNSAHRGDPSTDTADFNDQAVGNLRVDYVLPSRGLKVIASGVVWPNSDTDQPHGKLLQTINAASDHHLVWIDIER